MSTLVDRLKDFATYRTCKEQLMSDHLIEAADLIERQAKQIELLRAVIQRGVDQVRIAGSFTYLTPRTYEYWVEALEQTK